MRRILLTTGGLLLLGFVLIQFVPAARTNPPVEQKVLPGPEGT